jgi:hypothetical protein
VRKATLKQCLRKVHRQADGLNLAIQNAIAITGETKTGKIAEIIKTALRATLSTLCTFRALT